MLKQRQKSAEQLAICAAVGEPFTTFYQRAAMPVSVLNVVNAVTAVQFAEPLQPALDKTSYDFMKHVSMQDLYKRTQNYQQRVLMLAVFSLSLMWLWTTILCLRSAIVSFSLLHAAWLRRQRFLELISFLSCTRIIRCLLFHIYKFQN